MPNDKLVRDSRPEFPGNSETKTEISAKKEKLRPVTKGRIVKKGWGTKFKESLVNNDNQSIMDYIFYDILIPAAKDTISNIVSDRIS